MADSEKKQGARNSDELLDFCKARLRFGRSDDVVILFVPSHDRNDKRLNNQDKWASEAIDLMSKLYGGATGFKELIGCWYDADQDKNLDDEPIMIQSLAKRTDVEDEAKLRELSEFCRRMGKEMKQSAIGIVLNDAIHFMTKFN